MKKVIIWVVLVVVVVGLLVVFGNKKELNKDNSIRIGWISDLTGQASKYGSIEAARIAVDEINSAGGIKGRMIELIEEDGKCEATTALNAARKLIDVNKVDYILGGHCSTETITIAPVAEKKRVIMLASISTSPAITNLGDYVFRTSPISTQQSEIVARYAINNNIKKVGVIYEIKDYPKPIADAFKKSFEELGGQVSVFDGFSPEENDFRSILSRMKEANVEAIFISPQAPEKASLIIKQINELGLNVKIFGNEQVGSKTTIDAVGNSAIEGLVFGEPKFDVNDPITKEFIEKYNSRYGTNGLPLGIWTAECYDAVHILADAIDASDDDVEKIKEYLYGVKKYVGASGSFSIDENGDGVREYKLKTIKEGKIIDID
jgi:branched-chain amino acid transport system substrate-binding protein